MRAALTSVMVGLTAGLVCVAPAGAAITVSNTNDAGPGSLREAINTAPAGQTIDVPAGTYTLTSEPLVINKDLTIAGHSSSDTIIRNGGSVRFRVFEIIGPLSATIQDVTIRDGFSTETGAGILSTEADLDLTRDAITSNEVNGSGGAAAESGKGTKGAGVRATSGSLDLLETNVTGNRLVSSGGEAAHGGTAYGAGIAAEAPLTVTRSSVSQNRAVVNGGNGPPGTEQFGGIAEGAGIWSEGDSLTVTESHVDQNVAEAAAGPGAHGGTGEGAGLWTLSSLKVYGTTFLDNELLMPGGRGPADAEQHGGLAEGAGIWVDVEDADASQVLSSTFAGNRAIAVGGPGSHTAGFVEGGGIWAVAEEGGGLSLADSTVAQNLAEASGPGEASVQGGGAWLVTEEAATISLTAVTLARNAAVGPGEGASEIVEGDNIFWPGSTVSLADSIVADPVGPGGNCSDPIVPGGPQASRGFNLETGDDCGLNGPGDRPSTDPMLGSLAANDGPTPTMALPANSPAVDQGSGFGLLVDQRGVQRPVDLPTVPNGPGSDGSDIGAYELRPSSGLTLGKLTRNKKKGTATLTATVPLPAAGTIVLSGKDLKKRTVNVDGTEATLKLTLIPTGKARKSLNRRKGKKRVNRRKVSLTVTYSPLANAPVSVSRKAGLVKKKKRRKGRHKRHDDGKR